MQSIGQAGMTTTSGAESDPILRARGEVMVHRAQAAEALYRKALETQPDNAEALNFVAMCELGRGEFDSAREHLEKAVHIDPEEANFRKNLGILQLALGHAQDAIDTFDQVIAMDPKELSAPLHRAAALEQLGSTYDATAAYYHAIATAQAAFSWRNRNTTPPVLQPVVRHAIDYIQRNQQQIFMELMQPVRAQYGAAALARVEQGLAIYLKHAAAQYPDPRQSCAFFYIPGLSAEPMLDAAHMPGMAALATAGDTWLAELDTAAAEQLGEPYFGTHDLALLREQGVLDGDTGARLTAWFLYRNGDREPAARQHLPRSLAAVESLPQRVQVENLGPNVYFATLAPGTHILPSCGITNARVNVEIPLQVDGRCVRSVAGHEETWRMGACVAYDGSFAHELWNHGPGPCTALVLDAWHPELSAAERAALPLLFEGISQFHMAAGVEPPFGN
ncbi:aspartyl/asparaginyl beta-hydroxylase domain-containing protein [Rhodanobacter denitrificans]|uniref:aspartyl/asparaginyl beta-hydroxylase domain-containing protein n=1 Tax=Rhodanobacter denitrificans TaxID=666685 RepID=UPI000682A6E9|nr:aspartyl/asparaginyl beta-hydroxylase domain-containing protein [Rhodanobacter denitrificans]UJM90523.1 aspartyl/asparaginyl beta-hydroxylase domain-containing protein [Rhodanobacter denitrificans]